MARKRKETPAPTPEDYANHIKEGMGVINDACRVLEQPIPQRPAAIDDPLQNPDFKNHLEKEFKRDERIAVKAHETAERTITHSSQTAFFAALKVPEYNYVSGGLPQGTITGTLNPQGMLAVLDSGLIPGNLLPVNPDTGQPVTKEQAVAILKAGGDNAQAFASDFSQRMKSDVLDKALADPATLDKIIDTACDAAEVRPPSGLPNSKQPSSKTPWTIVP